MTEAQLEDFGSGVAPASDGWFVVNVRDAQWLTSEDGERKPSGSECAFGGDEFAFRELGARLHVLEDVRPADGVRREVRTVRRQRPSYGSRLPWA